MNNKLDFINSFLSFEISLFGISITIFTVIFSFIVNKKQEIKMLINEVEKINTPRIKQKISFLKRNINKLKKINTIIFVLIITSLFFFLVANFLKEIIISNIIFYNCVYVVFCFQIVFLIYSIYLLSMNYFKTTKIDNF